ncbi:MAG TPA: V-type ATP synthase subunit A [Nitrospiraceae bacterium]|jgi:V/A-type H+-transporting ATPase subunit A|nr:V-type ATP synthase subunit A [Nitrospiraceae bacterium]
MSGIIVKISGPTVTARGMATTRLFNRVAVGRMSLLGEVIRIRRDEATIQVYEETTGLTLGEEVEDAGEPLLAELGPGLLSSTFDGVQRPLEVIAAEQGAWITRGVTLPAVSRNRRWTFTPAVQPGTPVTGGVCIGTVQETEHIQHRVLVPPGVSGVIREIREGTFTVTDTIALLDGDRPLTMLQRWPVRTPRPQAERLPPIVPLITGQRVFDMLFPVALGGTVIVPGGFGTGKTVVEQTLAKYARADIIVYIGCGERGNEMTEVLADFPHLTDPVTGLPLMQRTILIINTSNMPVAARETSIYTGITLAEYYRDMGYAVAVMADSTSRWAEATREISARLEEMPGEEGYPTYLSTKLAGFYERGGRVRCLGDPNRQGSVTIVSAISPPGGDYSEPVTQSSMQVAGALWALDSTLAHRRHFPAINWKRSFSLYPASLDPWFRKEVAPDWPQLRADLAALLQKEEELQEIVQLVGIDALQDQERLVIETSRLVREEYLRQNAYSEIDAACPLEKQYWMLKALLTFLAYGREVLKQGRPIDQLVSSPFRAELARLKEIPADACVRQAQTLIEKMEQELRM